MISLFEFIAFLAVLGPPADALPRAISVMTGATVKAVWLHMARRAFSEAERTFAKLSPSFSTKLERITYS